MIRYSQQNANKKQTSPDLRRPGWALHGQPGVPSTGQGRVGVYGRSIGGGGPAGGSSHVVPAGHALGDRGGGGARGAPRRRFLRGLRRPPRPREVPGAEPAPACLGRAGLLQLVLRPDEFEPGSDAGLGPSSNFGRADDSRRQGALQGGLEAGPHEGERQQQW